MYIKIATKSAHSRSFDLTKEGSDFSVNQLVLNAVIGTLVKFGASGKIEPYLAEGWEISEDRKEWSFKLRKGLQFEDGLPITPILFQRILTHNLKIYSKQGSLLIFDHLKGWNDFVTGKTDHIMGISVSQDSINFQFDQKPDEFLEILRMPYFGLWRNDERTNKIISSGPYTIVSNDLNGVQLELRTDWFTVQEYSSKIVHISFIDLEDIREEVPKNTIIQMPFYANNQRIINNAFWIISPPTMIDAFVLSPIKDNVFNDKYARKAFANRLRTLNSETVPSRFFYPTATTEGLTIHDGTFDKKHNSKKVTFALERTTYSKSEIDRIKKIIQFSLEGSGIDFEVIPRDVNDSNWFTKTDSNAHFDARVASVDIGAHPSYSAIKMMFCTKLGVNFPEHNGKLCSLIEDGIKSGKVIDQDFIDKFNSILNEESIVIPIEHHSTKWLVSNSIDPISLPATNPYPQFELLRTK